SVKETEYNPFLALESNARLSNIKSLCEKAVKNGYESCIWICFSRGSCFLAKDIPIKEDEDGIEIHRLRNCRGWWKRISLRSAVKIQEVKIHAIRTQSNKEIEVVVLLINYSLEIADIQREIEELSPNTTNCDAGFNKNERRQQLRKCFRNLQYRQPMLDFYWNSKGKSDCQQFLKESGLVTQYTYLRTCHYLDAAVCYGDIFPGESIPALLLVDGWDVSRLLTIIGFAIVISIVVTAIGTAAGYSISTGLTAGSYAFGAVSVLIATLTLFSAVV
ncbi:hypothetical protein F1880_008442, partial [Penicillium rolfsii]